MFIIPQWGNFSVTAATYRAEVRRRNKQYTKIASIVLHQRNVLESGQKLSARWCNFLVFNHICFIVLVIQLCARKSERQHVAESWVDELRVLSKWKIKITHFQIKTPSSVCDPRWQEPSRLRSVLLSNHKTPSQFWNLILQADKAQTNDQSDSRVNSGEVIKQPKSKKQVTRADTVQAAVHESAADRCNGISSSVKIINVTDIESIMEYWIKIRQTVSSSKWHNASMLWALNILKKASSNVRASGPEIEDKNVTVT